MKTVNISLFALFSVFAYSGFAQTDFQRPVSKDVQKVANRQLLRHERLLTVLTIDAFNQSVAKGVQSVSNRIVDNNTYQGNMRSSYPIWIIGKAVNKIGMPGQVVEPKKDKNSNLKVIVRG